MTEKLLTSEQQDRLGLSLIALAKEFWVLRDRVAVLEKVLDRQGISATEEIETYEPDRDFEAELAAARDRFISSVLDPISGPGVKD